jgi:hypothetical protein
LPNKRQAHKILPLLPDEYGIATVSLIISLPSFGSEKKLKTRGEARLHFLATSSKIGLLTTTKLSKKCLVPAKVPYADFLNPPPGPRIMGFIIQLKCGAAMLNLQLHGAK